MLLVSQAAIAGPLFPSVLVSPAPLKPYVDEILKGHGEATSLLRPGQDAHDTALSPSQAAALANADILIVPDLAMTPTIAAMVKKNKRVKVIELVRLAGAAPLPYAPENPWLEAQKHQANHEDEHNHHDSEGQEEHDHEDEHSHEHKGLDPHLWLDPGRMADLAPALADAMATHVPEASAALKANANALSTHLTREVIPALRELFRRDVTVSTAVGKPQIPFITYHAGYQYFIQRFDLKHYGEITQRPENLMGAKTASTMLNAAQQVRIRCIIGEVETPLMKRIAEKTGARIVILGPEQLPRPQDVDALDWIKNDYDRFLYVTAKTVAGCL